MRRARKAFVELARSALGAYVSVLFGRRTWVGALLLAASFARPASGLAGLVAVLAATVTAILLGYRKDAIRAGYYGYNALLLGVATNAGRAADMRVLLLVALAGVAACLLTAVLGDLLGRGAHLPVLALPFVVLSPLLTPALARVPTRDALATAPWLDHAISAAPWPVLMALRSFGALLFQPTPLVGLAVAACALALSRVATLAALAGMASAVAFGLVLGLPRDSGTMLIASYNGALTSLAVAYFFVPGRVSLLIGVGGAAIASWLSAALVVLVAPLGLSVLAWPFVIATLVVVRALHLRAPDRPPFPSPLPLLSPEANVEYAAALSQRFGLPGPPQLALPFAGTWTVSQGKDGAHTHRDAWADALDFEVTCERGFPFRGQGAAREDYLCFGLPVTAPAPATVVAVHEGAPDGAPGEQDLAHPWGNAVVLHLGADLYAVLAHLQCGSIAVRPGQLVALGQHLGACGSSGRSPRPHLHLQLQRTAELGAPAIPFRMVNYVVDQPRGARHYVHVGVPGEGERVGHPAPSAIADAFSLLPPGLELTLDTDDAQTVRLRSEITLLGERYLVDLDRHDRLYFTALHGNLTFTQHTGPAKAPLRALFRALPRLPSVAGASITFEDRPPARALLSLPSRIAHELLRVVVDPVETHARVELAEEAEALVVRTEVAAGLRGRLRRHFRGRVELDASGLRSIELHDERTPRPSSWRARRAA